MARIDAVTQNAMCDAAADRADVGSGTAQIQIYSGVAPGSFGGTPAGRLLVTFSLPNPAFSAAGTPDGQADLLGVPITGTGVAAGTAGYARLRNRNGDTIMDTDNIGTEVVLSTTTISVGLSVSLTSWLLTVGAGSA